MTNYTSGTKKENVSDTRICWYAVSINNAMCAIRWDSDDAYKLYKYKLFERRRQDNEKEENENMHNTLLGKCE